MHRIGLSLACFLAAAIACADPPASESESAGDIIRRLLEAQKDRKPTNPPAPPKAADKAMSPADPKSKDETLDPHTEGVLDELIRQAPPPAFPEPRPATKPATPARTAATPDVDQVIEGVFDAEKDGLTQKRREALRLYQQAQAAEKANRLSDALRRARDARRILPGDNGLARYVASLEQRIGVDAHSQEVSRAKGFLASALTAAQAHAEAGRHDQAEDLLRGVVTAARLFDASHRAGLYGRSAERMLDQIKAARKQAADKGGSVDAAPAPLNFRRILPRNRGVAPAWYVLQMNRLAAPITVDYRQAPISEVLSDLSVRLRVPVVLDDAIARANVDRGLRVDLRGSGIPAESVLDIVARRAGLEYVVFEKSIVLTTPARAMAYVRELPEAVQQPWLAARILFPEMNADLFATPTEEEQSIARPNEEAPRPHLASGKALVDEIRRLLP